MTTLNHRAHHLYNVIQYLCRNDQRKCTASRETLCRMLGDSPRSSRVVTEAIKQLKDAKLIRVKERCQNSHIITLERDHEARYTLLLRNAHSAACKGAKEERTATTACATQIQTMERNREIIAEVDEDFKDEDFELDE